MGIRRLGFITALTLGLVAPVLAQQANAATNRLTGMSVSSSTDTAKDAVGLKVTFEAFADGTIYPATTALTVASQNLEVAINNSGYEKLGG